ncbi:MAG TPA: hypothetical protein DCE55_21925 [Planctomycetaceae bacterium]|nr:hypothetical protein [Planctomycetaceae bacterium]|tara:strand:- start:5505 stop:6572 length:1068 start_codon:yes stop_codon:yes gene_type:complete
MQNFLFLLCLGLSLAIHAALGWIRVAEPTRQQLALDEIKSGETTISVQVVQTQAAVPKQVELLTEDMEPVEELTPRETPLPDPEVEPVERVEETVNDSPVMEQPDVAVEVPQTNETELERAEIKVQQPVEVSALPTQQLRKRPTEAIVMREPAVVTENLQPIQRTQVKAVVPEAAKKPLVRAPQKPELPTVHRPTPSRIKKASVTQRERVRPEPELRPLPKVKPVAVKKVPKKLVPLELEKQVAIEVPRPVAVAAKLGARTPAKLQTRVPILYPETLQQEGVEGRVVLQAQVGTNGHLTQVKVKKSSGHQALDKAALESVRQWVFRPARQGEETTSQQVLIPVEFRVRLAEDESN